MGSRPIAKLSTIALAGVAAIIFSAISAMNATLVGWQINQGNFSGAAVLTPIYVLPVVGLCIAAVWFPLRLWRKGRTPDALIVAALLFVLALPAAFFEIIVIGQ